MIVLGKILRILGVHHVLFRHELTLYLKGFLLDLLRDAAALAAEGFLSGSCVMLRVESRDLMKFPTHNKVLATTVNLEVALLEQVKQCCASGL